VKYVRKCIPVSVRFAIEAGVTQTLEGPVRHLVGDAVLTGVSGEHWPISRQRFEDTYEPMGTTPMGSDGLYMKRPLIVSARQTDVAEVVALTDSESTLKARPGDWIVNAPDGGRWVVANDIFQETYVVAG
jgi:hypothetical protein